MTDSARFIVEAYDLVPPVELFVLNGSGVNNVTRGVRTGAGDFVLGNLLFQADDLTAVLDWEFVAQDVRAMDIATLLVSVLFAHGAADM